MMLVGEGTSEDSCRIIGDIEVAVIGADVVAVVMGADAVRPIQQRPL